MRVYIDGSAGTTGLVLEDRLSGLKNIHLIKPDSRLRKDIETRRACLNEADVAFLCLPDDAAREAVSLTDNPDTVIIDASTAHRISPDWAYGFPELSAKHLDKIKGSNRIAVPGCHATGFAALVYPAIQGGYIRPDEIVYCHSLTGYSGGGKALIAEHENSSVSAAKPYALGLNHKHLPEMQFVCGLQYPPVFTPILINTYKGMIVNIPLGHTNAKDTWEFFYDYYKNAATVSIMPFMEGADLPLEGMNGSDDLEIYVFGNENQTVLSARFDNLGKGSSGAAVQCMKVRKNIW